jgi:HlyD family secretion protein
VLEILVPPGGRVQPGQPILRLDTSDLELARQRVMQQLQGKRAQRRTLLLEREQTLKDERGDLELAQLELAFLESRHRQRKTLFEQGLVSRDELLQAELDLKKQVVEERRLRESAGDAAAAHRARVEALDGEIALLQRDLAQAEHRLERADAAASVAGMVTWVADQLGATVRSGEPLARVADVSRYKVSATISDFYANRLREGLAVRIQLGDRDLTGFISLLQPEVSDGVLGFEVALNDADLVAARANQRVSVWIRTDERRDVLRLRRGSALPGPGEHQVFVIGSGTAQRRRVRAGMNGTEFIEIAEGLVPGERVVLDRLEHLEHLERIKTE